MPTIYDVARKAKVSIAAVSLVINDANTNRVGKVKREQILQVASQLGYSSNSIAKALAEGGTRIIGLVIPLQEPIFFHPFIAEVLSGIQHYVSDQDFHLMIYSHREKAGRVTRSEIQQSRYADGVVVLNTRMSSKADMAATIDELRAANISFVMVNGYSGKETINYVGVDDGGTGEIGTNYLLDRGHSRIAILSGREDSPISSTFLRGYRKALKARAIELCLDLQSYCEYDPDRIARAVTTWLDMKSRPTAIYCADDLFVPPVYAALASKGVRVPNDISILARGSSILGQHLAPQLTTITVPGVAIGERAAELLIAAVRNKSAAPRKVLLPCSLIERDSCMDLASTTR